MALEDSVDTLEVNFAREAILAVSPHIDVDEEFDKAEKAQEEVETITESLMTITEGMNQADIEDILEALGDNASNPVYMRNLARLKTELGIDITLDLIDWFPAEIGGNNNHIDGMIYIIEEALASGATLRKPHKTIPAFSRKKIRDLVQTNPNALIKLFKEKGVISAEIMERHADSFL